MSKTALGPMQLPIQWVPGFFSGRESSPGVKLVTHICFVVESKNEWSYTSNSPICFHSLDRVNSLTMTKIGAWSKNHTEITNKMPRFVWTERRIVKY